MTSEQGAHQMFPCFSLAHYTYSTLHYLIPGEYVPIHLQTGL